MHKIYVNNTKTKFPNIMLTVLSFSNVNIFRKCTCNIYVYFLKNIKYEHLKTIIRTFKYCKKIPLKLNQSNNKIKYS